MREDDYLVSMAASGMGARALKALGLPAPVRLARGGTATAMPLAGKRFLSRGLPGGYALEVVEGTLAALGARVLTVTDGEPAFDGVVVDATGCRNVADLRALYDTFHPVLRRLATCARIVVVAAQPAEQDIALAAGTARGIEGFVRSLAREAGKRGVTANLLYAARAVPERIRGPLRFFCGGGTAYVTGQALSVSGLVAAPAAGPQAGQRLAGKVAVVTGAARGIGAAIAERLAGEGATVVCLDVPAAQAPLAEVAARIGGVPLALDITGDPMELANFLGERFGGVDIVVHNAGITRDKTLANMRPEAWDQVLSVNFAAIAAADAALDARGLLRDGGRVVCLSSIAGLAGNYGQSNYALSKAALVGYVAARAAGLAGRGITVNAIAPGFIETPMTKRMPFFTREFARRLNSLGQGGLPEDVAEAVCFLACPDACGVTGQTLRVCGQSLVGA